MSISDAVAVLGDLADGRAPDSRRLAMGLTALRAKCGAEVEGAPSVFAQAVDAPDAGLTEQVEIAWQMVVLQAQRVDSALDAGTSLPSLTPDFHFLVISMRRLRRSVAMLASQTPQHENLTRALAEFDAALPQLSRLPDIGERLDGPALREPATSLSVQPAPMPGATRHVVRWGNCIFDVDLAIKACVLLRSLVCKP